MKKPGDEVVKTLFRMIPENGEEYYERKENAGEKGE